jgi:UPF0716 protein FxsA
VLKYLVLALVAVPLAELYLLVRIGQEIGAGPTLLMVVASGLIGGLLARKEGLRVFRRWRESMAQGRMPEEGLLGGMLVLAGGVLLVIPGVLTDLAGLLLLFPPTRRWVAGRVRRKLERGMADGSVRVTTFQSGPFPGAPFGVPPPGEPFASRAAPPRLERRPGSEEDAEFTEEDGPGRG